MPRDFTCASLGIRVFDDACAVIEKKAGVHGWVEDGHRLPLPLPEGFDTILTIPLSRIGLALREYESQHPADGLRELLTGKTG